jgi:hypothetical protein
MNPNASEESANGRVVDSMVLDLTGIDIELYPRMTYEDILVMARQQKAPLLQ